MQICEKHEYLKTGGDCPFCDILAFRARVRKLVLLLRQEHHYSGYCHKQNDMDMPITCKVCKVADEADKALKGDG